MDEAPYQAVPETVQAASSTGARDEAKADSMLEAEKRAANAGLGLAPMCQRPAAHPKQAAPRWCAAKDDTQRSDGSE